MIQATVHLVIILINVYVFIKVFTYIWKEISHPFGRHTIWPISSTFYTDGIVVLLPWSLTPFPGIYRFQVPSHFSQFSRSVVSDSLRPHKSKHTRPPCPSPTPGVHSNPCPSSRWCHPAISSSVVPFSSCPQSLLASGSFPVSQLFPWGEPLLKPVMK